jgi:diamine N-acetyltransferase
MTVTIEKTTPADAERLAAISGATFALACPPGTTQDAIDRFVAEHFSVDHWAVYLSDPARDVFVASVDGVDAGYSMLVATETTDADVLASISTPAAVELSKFYTLAVHHGSGLAASLMAATVAAAVDRGAPAIWLGVNHENERANRFYEKNGFARVGTKKFLVGGRYEDDYVRERIL